MPAPSAQREYWFILASSALKLKRSWSLMSAVASPYLSAHSAAARGKIRARDCGSPAQWFQGHAPRPSPATPYGRRPGMEITQLDFDARRS